jgi:enoyl-CoA hydratase
VSNDLIAMELDGPVLHVVLNRPDKRNALTREMIFRIQAILRDAQGDAAVRVVILRAAGPDFCAGFDLTRLDAEERAEDRMVREDEELFSKALELRHYPKPTIAAVQGACVAAGILLSQVCDLVVASDDAYFYNPLVRMGGVGLEVLLEPWDIGIRMAKRYLFTGERIPAEVALRLGMVTDLATREALPSVTRELAAKIAAMPPVTIRLLKKSLNHTQDLMGMRDSLEYHFAMHEFGHTTQESEQLLHAARSGRSLKEYFARRDDAGA